MVAKTFWDREHELARESKKTWALLKQTFADWSEDNASRLAASLAFYTMLSLAPLLVLAVKAVGVFFTEKTAKAQVHAYMVQLMGHRAGDAAVDMIGPLSRPGAGRIATIISCVVLAFSASGVFGELQNSLNTIWEVKPKSNRGIWGMLKDRFFSFALVLGTCFLLLVSLIVTTALAGLTQMVHDDATSILWHLLNFVISTAVVTLLFMLIFKYLPDVNVRWSDVWVGGLTTGLLFSVGKLILGWYLGRASTTSVYAAAGSLISVLLWVYYSAQILFFGAELTQVRAHQEHAVKPAENAVKVTEEQRANEGMVSNDRVKELSAEDDKAASVAPAGDRTSELAAEAIYRSRAIS